MKQTKPSMKPKTYIWKEVLEGAIRQAGGKDMWKVINNLNSTQETNSPKEVMSQNVHTITDAKEKASIFVNHYARASNLLLQPHHKVQVTN